VAEALDARTADCPSQQSSEVTAKAQREALPDGLRPQPRSSTLIEAMKTYKRNHATRLINWWFRTLTQLGLGAPYRQILTVPGRKTGRPHSTPVDVIEVGGHRRLVAGYGPANWVLNSRARHAVFRLIPSTLNKHESR
jgi:F420H(2)-dependent quinone reductase